MRIESLDQSIETLNQLTNYLADLPESQEKAIAAGAQISIAATYLVEMLVHMNAGMEPYDALVAAVNGEMKLF